MGEGIVSDGGNMMMFVSALGMAGIMTALLAMYASHCFLHVLCDSSGGIDEIRWGHELFIEWWWKPLYCIGMLIFWGLTTAVVVGPLFAASPDGFLIAYPIALWAIVPLGLISPLAGNGALTILHVPLLGRLLRHPAAALQVSLVTLPLPALTALFVWLTVVQGRLLFAVPAAVTLPAAVLFYARAWGRLTWFLLNEKPKKRNNKEDERIRLPSPADNEAAKPEIPEFDLDELLEEPAPAVEEEIEEEFSRHKKPYGLLDEKKADREWRQRRRVEQPVEPGYDTTLDEPPPVPDESEKYLELHEKEQEMKRRAARMSRREWARNQKPPTVRRALGRPLYAFLVYGQTVKAWVNMSVLAFVALLFLRMCLKYAPLA
jgi:hypothetical protein